jgi:hypothetical protein
MQQACDAVAIIYKVLKIKFNYLAYGGYYHPTTNI